MKKEQHEHSAKHLLLSFTEVINSHNGLEQKEVD